MFTRIFMIALIAGVVYLNYTNPTVEDHKAFLLDELQQSYPLPASMQEQIWKQVDYSSFLVCSFMKTREDSTMISSGYLKKINLVNTKWVDDIKTRLQKDASHY